LRLFFWRLIFLPSLASRRVYVLVLVPVLVLVALYMRVSSRTSATRAIGHCRGRRLGHCQRRWLWRSFFFRATSLFALRPLSCLGQWLGRLVFRLRLFRRVGQSIGSHELFVSLVSLLLGDLHPFDVLPL